MDTSLLTRGLVRFDWDVEDQRAVFAGMAAVLQAEGFVKESFEAAIVAREAKYPTALPTVPEEIAIPHADAEHILTPLHRATAARPPGPVIRDGQRQGDPSGPSRLHARSGQGRGAAGSAPGSRPGLPGLRIRQPPQQCIDCGGVLRGSAIHRRVRRLNSQ